MIPLYSNNNEIPNELAKNIGFLFMQAGRKGQRFAERERNKDSLRFSHYVVMTYVVHFPDCSQNELSVKLQLDASQFAKLIFDLKRAGLVERKTSKDDGRKYVLNATEDGHVWQKERSNRNDTITNLLLSPLSPKERNVLLELLLKII